MEIGKNVKGAPPMTVGIISANSTLCTWGHAHLLAQGAGP